MRRIPSRELGSYVLEIAGVIMGVVVFIVGATDITKIFQARSAVRAAVNEGTRCLYPTDAGCVSVAPDALSAPSRAFDVWVWGSGYSIPQESYMASAKWQSEPIMEVPIQRDDVTDVTIEQRQFQYRPYDVLYPVSAYAPYFLQTGYLPLVSGGTPLAPRFVDPNTREPLKPRARLALSGVKGTTDVRVQGRIKSDFDPKLLIGSVSFTVSDAWPTAEIDQPIIAALPASVRSTLGCYSGSSVTGASGQTLNWSKSRARCRYRTTDAASSVIMNSGKLRVPLLFRVTGTSSGTERGAEGKVTIAISWTSPTGGSGYRELGGRVFSNGSSASFVPRGMALADVINHTNSRDDELVTYFKKYTRELTYHKELPLVPVDAKVTVSFFLMSMNGLTAGWKGGALELWHPQYRFVNERQDCGYSESPTTCAAPQGLAPRTYLSLTPDAPFQALSATRDRCAWSEDATVERDVNTPLRRLEQSARAGKTPQAFSFLIKVPTDTTVCPSKISTASCDKKGSEYLKGCGPTPLSNEQVAKQCQIASPAGGLVQVVGRTVKSRMVNSRRSRACSDAPLPQCAQAHAQKVDTARYYESEKCDVAETISAPTLVVGPLNVNSCESREAEVQNLYRRQHAIPSEVPISVVALPSAPIFSPDPPVGACVSAYSADGSSREMLCGQGLSAAAAERCCAASGQRCRKQEIIRTPDPIRERGKGLILAAAQQRVVESVQAGYPQARHQAICAATDPNCLEVSTALVNNDTEATVTAKVRVPLSLLHLVDDDLAVVQHASTRTLERSAMR